MTRLSNRTAAQRDLDECARALRNAMHAASQGAGRAITPRTLAAQLNWRESRTAQALEDLARAGHAAQSRNTGSWYSLEGA